MLVRESSRSAITLLTDEYASHGAAGMGYRSTRRMFRSRKIRGQFGKRSRLTCGSFVRLDLEAFFLVSRSTRLRDLWHTEAHRPHRSLLSSSRAAFTLCDCKSGRRTPRARYSMAFEVEVMQVTMPTLRKEATRPTPFSTDKAVQVIQPLPAVGRKVGKDVPSGLDVVGIRRCHG